MMTVAAVKAVAGDDGTMFAGGGVVGGKPDILSVDGALLNTSY
jgi:hypothetical protein